MAKRTLSQLRDALQQKLEVPAVFTCVNTRLIIQTGVNLKQIAPEHDTDPQRLTKVLDALERMGMKVEL